jgi:VIT1/CCC1 family predicted Fe2+/Mn2+ transporter/rubrerythrin
VTDRLSARRRIGDAMRSNWRDEVRGALTYRALAVAEADPRRRDILIRLAEAEERHAGMWEDHLRALGETPPDRAAVGLGEAIPQDAPDSRTAWLRRLEADEGRDAERYRQLLGLLPVGPLRSAVERMAADELGHAETLGRLTAGEGPAAAASDAAATPAAPLPASPAASAPDPPPSRPGPRGIDPRAALAEMLTRERWHVRSATGWIGDAIYGANDGLGAIFGIVAGVAGYTGGSHLVVISGVAGMLASALSMGSGAYLASRAQDEVHAAEVARERRELTESPAEEREELVLFYQLKGLSEQEARDVVAGLARSPQAMLASLAQEELGINLAEHPSALLSAGTSSLATALGAIVPVIPFFFLQGAAALLVAAGVSLLAHFAVGALKTLVTARSWVASGLEMTIVGAVEGAITFGLGILLRAA